MGTDKGQKNHTLSFPKWTYAEDTKIEKREEEDKRNVAATINIAMELFKSQVSGLTVCPCPSPSL